MWAAAIEFLGVRKMMKGPVYQRIGSTGEPLSAQVAEQIIDLITRRELKPGDTLPSQQELSESLGVSRTVVREGLQLLTGLGVIRSSQGIRAQIIETDPGRFLMALRVSAGVGDEGIYKLLDVREILEPEIAAIAAVKVTREDVARLERAVSRMEEDLTADDMEDYVAADNAFHIGLAEATGNGLLVYILTPLISLLQEMRRIAVRAKGATEEAQACHRAIVGKLKDRDPDGAREAMRTHLAQVRDSIGRATSREVEHLESELQEG